MAGVMSGVFHAPLTGVFLIAELTGGYQLFIPLMIVSTASYLTINTFEPHSIYSMRLARKGELLTHHKDKSILTLMTLDAIIEKNRPLLSPDMYLAQHIGLAICGLMMRTAFGVFGILWGIIREIVNGVFRVAIGVIVAILSTIAFFGFILWLFTL